MEKLPLIIDTDPGIDDAVALTSAFFAPNLDIKLLCSTAGNLGIDVTTRNVLHLLDIFDLHIPVAKGEAHPLNRPLVTASGKHGKMGLGDYVYTKVYKKPIDIPAFEAMHTALQLYYGITILVLGPLTNVAMLLNKYPEDKKRIKQIVFMGGTKDNVNLENKPYPEFNISRDPEACEIVLKSGVNVVIIPMDFGHYGYISAAEIKNLSKINATGKFFKIMYANYKDGHVSQENAATHDSCATAFLIEPTLFKLENVNAKVKYFNNVGILVSNIVNRNSKIKLAVDMDYNGFKNLYYGLLSIAKMKDE